MSPKPSLPHGWSCHVSKSVPGKCYYFNRFTGAKTWDLGELLPGHSDNPTYAGLVPGSAQLPLVVSDPHHQPGLHQPPPPDRHAGHGQALPRNQKPSHLPRILPGAGHHHHQPVHDPGHHPSQGASSFNKIRLDYLQSQGMFPVNQGHHQPQRSKLAGPPLDLEDDVFSLGVDQLEAMLAEKRRNLQEMARKMSVDSNVDSSSVESGFVSLIGREEEGMVGREVSDRQKELTDSGGLYRDWGKVGGVPEGPSRPKRVKIEFDNSNGNNDAVSACEDGVGVTIGAVDNENNDNAAVVHANLSDVNDINNSDSDSLDEESLCGADPEELAALAKLDRKFPTAPAVTPAKREDTPSVTQASISPPELILLDTDCQFSPEPSSDEGGDSAG